jgi:flagellar FliL protein
MGNFGHVWENGKMRWFGGGLVLALTLAGPLFTDAKANEAPKPEQGHEAAKPEKGGEPAKGAQPVSLGMYYDLPDLTVNLISTGRPIFLKISLSLQMGKEGDRAALDAHLPLLIDAFQAYLRELHVEDLRGSLGMYRLRGELLLRAAAVSSPIEINDVMFKEILVR